MGQGDVDPDDYYAMTLLTALHPDEHPGAWVEGYQPNMTADDLEYAAQILSRYLDWVRLAGRDY